MCDTEISSPVGRTKTIPDEEDEVPLSLGIFSCAKYYRGYFNVYGNAARRDTVDYMVHLGDYYYEEEDGHGARAMDPPRELATLHDFRTRIGQYRTDEDLQYSHQQYPWITTWVSQAGQYHAGRLTRDRMTMRFRTTTGELAQVK